MERERSNTTQPHGRLRRAVARVDATVFSYFDRRAKERAGEFEDLHSVRRREIRNVFRRSDKVGLTADLLRRAANGAVARHERRQGNSVQG